NEITNGGGYGGNERTKPFLYDGLPDHLAALTVRRYGKTCYLDNQDASVYRYRWWWVQSQASYSCPTKDATHNYVYWNEKLDKINGGFSPANDALYAATMVAAMYRDWFGIPVVQKKDGSPDK